MKLKTLILDDEKENIEHLSYWLEKYCASQIELVAIATDIQQATEGISRYNPDLLFVDVELQHGITSFDLIENLADWDGKIIFITAHKDYAIQAIKTNKTTDYLLKPLSIKELINAVTKCYETFSIPVDEENQPVLKQEIDKEKNFISITHLNQIQLIRKSEISHLTSSGNYTEIFLKNNTSTMCSKIIKFYEAILEDENFIRVHNSHIINIDYLTKIVKEDGLYCIMKNGEIIPISRRKKDLLMSLLNKV